MGKNVSVILIKAVEHIRAYAFWSPLDDGKGLRYGTLLVGYNNEKLVGNVVMKNPGSSRPVSFLSQRPDKRLEFSVDATMSAVAELFCLEQYGGAVRIYNLSDVREADFSKAKKILVSSDDPGDVLEIADSGVPTYLGWGELYKDPRFLGRAQAIFRAVEKTTPIYTPSIFDNLFFHPLFLMRYGRNQEACKRIRDEFTGLLNLRHQEQLSLF